MAAIYFFIKESTVYFYPFIDTFHFVDVIGLSDKLVSGVTLTIATNSHYLTVVSFSLEVRTKRKKKKHSLMSLLHGRKLGYMFYLY